MPSSDVESNSPPSRSTLVGGSRFIVDALDSTGCIHRPPACNGDVLPRKINPVWRGLRLKKRNQLLSSGHISSRPAHSWAVYFDYLSPDTLIFVPSVSSSSRRPLKNVELSLGWSTLWSWVPRNRPGLFPFPRYIYTRGGMFESSCLYWPRALSFPYLFSCFSSHLLSSSSSVSSRFSRSSSALHNGRNRWTKWGRQWHQRSHD